MLNADLFRRHRGVGSPAWIALGGRWFDLQEHLSAAEVVVEGIEQLPATPALLTTNASHKYDFLPLRCDLRRRGIPVVSIAKGKYFQHPVTEFLFHRAGVLPIVSRGYVIVVDFVAVHGRRPSDAEYRAIRSHLDSDEALPAGEPFARLSTQEREILGLPFQPAHESYRDALHRVYRYCMDETVRLARAAVARGHHVHIYPEGTVTGGLGAGHRGAVQLARALGVPIVPIGMSGCREFFRDSASVRMRGGRVSIRYGRPWMDPASFLPSEFRPFDPAHELEYGPSLDRATAELMARISALLTAEYRQPPAASPTGAASVSRFL